MRGIAVVFGMLLPAAGAAASPSEIVMVWDGALYDQTAQRVALTFEITMTADEWQDDEGTWHLEIAGGSGVARPAGGADDVSGDRPPPRPIPIRARFTRYAHGTPPVSLDDGTRRWPMRGDIYLIAEGHDIVEIEVGAEGAIPPQGSSRTSTTLPLPAAGEAGRTTAVERMSTLRNDGTGGGLIYSRTVSLFGAPHSELPRIGYVHIREISSRPARRSAGERDADRLIARIEYVAVDYPAAFENGVVINEAEYGEQLQLLAEAKTIAERLSVSRDLRRELDTVRRLVETRTDPATVSSKTRALARDLRRALWIHMSVPSPAAPQKGATIYASACAPCHGDRGRADGPRAAELVPPPRAFSDPTVIVDLSPYRAYNALTWGIAGTGMASFDATLAPPERWALAFHVFRFLHSAAPQPPPKGTPRLPLEEIAVLSDAELTDLLSATVAPADLPAAVAWLRTDGTDAAARSPLLAVRLRTRAVARATAIARPDQVAAVEARTLPILERLVAAELGASTADEAPPPSRLAAAAGILSGLFVLFLLALATRTPRR